MRAAAVVIADRKNGKVKRNEALSLVARYSSLVGFTLCTVKDRPQLLRRVADVLEGKAPATANDDKDIDRAIKNAEDGLLGMFTRDRATSAEINEAYFRLTGEQLGRHAVKRHGYVVHPARRGAPHGKRQKKRAAR
jgi:hypothetical protein